MSENRKCICLITPSIETGGAERVMTQLATYFSKEKNVEVHLLLFVQAERFYKVPDKVTIYEPDFNYREYSRPVFTIKSMTYLRSILKKLKPDVTLSFGGRYNSFVLLSALGLRIPVYISDRSKPSISYGFFLDILNRFVYRQAAGIISQTSIAGEMIYQRTRHKNIKVIGNPIRTIKGQPQPEKIILNVGRFIPSKKQKLLLDVFARINPDDWKLLFVGNGKTFQAVKQKAKKLGIGEKVIFASQQNNVDDYYNRASIFAFTSVSEGFPNALGEALNTPLPCISFDCEAGPRELIDDGINGFLVPLGDIKQYEKKLRLLIEDDALRNRFRQAAKEKMKQFSLPVIGEQYYQFMCGGKSTDGC